MVALINTTFTIIVYHPSLQFAGTHKRPIYAGERLRWLEKDELNKASDWLLHH